MEQADARASGMGVSHVIYRPLTGDRDRGEDVDKGCITGEEGGVVVQLV